MRPEPASEAGSCLKSTRRLKAPTFWAANFGLPWKNIRVRVFAYQEIVVSHAALFFRSMCHRHA
jgi:hypothetical protein